MHSIDLHLHRIPLEFLAFSWNSDEIRCIFVEFQRNSSHFHRNSTEFIAFPLHFNEIPCIFNEFQRNSTISLRIQNEFQRIPTADFITGGYLPCPWVPWRSWTVSRKYIDNQVTRHIMTRGRICFPNNGCEVGSCLRWLFSTHMMPADTLRFTSDFQRVSTVSSDARPMSCQHICVCRFSKKVSTKT